MYWFRWNQAKKAGKLLILLCESIEFFKKTWEELHANSTQYSGFEATDILEDGIESYYRNRELVYHQVRLALFSKLQSAHIQTLFVFSSNINLLHAGMTEPVHNKTMESGNPTTWNGKLSKEKQYGEATRFAEDDCINSCVIDEKSRSSLGYGTNRITGELDKQRDVAF